MKKNNCRSAALEFVDRGMSVIPLQPGGKKPLVESWAEYQRRIPAIEEIHEWFDRWPNANLGLVTGQISGIAAYDIDTEAGTKWAKNNLPKTSVYQATGKGYHLFYRTNGSPIPNKVRIADGVDVRGDGGYVVIAPSIHPSGKPYKLIFPEGFDGWDDLAPFPDISEKKEHKSTSLEPVERGQRNDTITKICGKYVRKGYSFEEISLLCRGYNSSLREPLPDSEVQTTVHSIWKKHNEAESTVKLVCAADIKPEAVKWLWPGWIPRGKLSLLAGAPGTGKSTLAFAIAVTVSISGIWPDGGQADQGNVVIWSGEDDAADTIIPRLIACGSDLSRIHILGGMSGPDPRTFDPAKDLPALQQALKGRGVTLLIVDPVVSAVASDSHKNTEVRRSLQPLVDLAADAGCAVLGISHFSKGTAGRDPVERVTGSLAFGALARVVLATAKLPEEHGGARLLARAKSNIGPDTGGFHYHLEQVEIPGYPGIFNSRVLWGKAVDGAARDLLAEAERNDDNKTETDMATEWLTDLLTTGSMKASDVTREAKAAGIGSKPLRSAREKLGVKTTKKGFPGCWWWSLPEDALAEDAPKMPQHAGRAPSENDDSYIYNNTSFLRRCPEGAQGKSKMPSNPEDAHPDRGHLRGRIPIQNSGKSEMEVDF
jgi:putative DNA primase/helicase